MTGFAEIRETQSELMILVQTGTKYVAILSQKQRMPVTKTDLIYRLLNLRYGWLGDDDIKLVRVIR